MKVSNIKNTFVLYAEYKDLAQRYQNFITKYDGYPGKNMPANLCLDNYTFSLNSINESVEHIKQLASRLSYTYSVQENKNKLLKNAITLSNLNNPKLLNIDNPKDMIYSSLVLKSYECALSMYIITHDGNQAYALLQELEKLQPLEKDVAPYIICQNIEKTIPSKHINCYCQPQNGEDEQPIN